ncbi:hypothetical protein G9A89_017604 [Geosiphon pyriformis]|nr:hypothetical protein G9A89_017604 [Geosiphon pyriformis]
MTATIFETIFRDCGVKDLQWRQNFKGKKIMILSKEKIFHDQVKNLRVSKSMSDRMLKNLPLSDSEAENLCIVGLQVCGLEGECVGITLPFNGLYIGFACGSPLVFPQYLGDLGSLKETLEVFYGWKAWHLDISRILDRAHRKALSNHYEQQLGRNALSSRQQFVRNTYFTPTKQSVQKHQ